MSGSANEIVGLYRRHAAAWTSARGDRLIEKPWLDLFVSLLTPGAAILDLGCGSGAPIGRYLTEHGFSVAGVDSSPEMTALFERNLPGQWIVVADMRTLKLEKRFGGILAWDSFFHLSHEDQRAMFNTFQGHSREGTALMFTSGPGYGEAIGELEGEPLYHASLDGAEYRWLLQQNAFEVVAQATEDPDCEGRTVWLARRP